MMSRVIGIALVLLALSSAWSRAAAVCDQTAEPSQADRDLWNTHQCWHEFFLWHYQAYGLRESDWKGRGWKDACNVQLEYGKHWNAVYLLTYGLRATGGQPFHATVDYRAVAEAADSRFHERIRHSIGDSLGAYGEYRDGVVTTFCPVYDEFPNGTPGSRAGDFMHEGWHAWMDKYGWDNGPDNGHRLAQGKCKGGGCDYFYFHSLSEFQPGELWQNDRSPERFHSPNQVQVEFLCDIAEYPENWVPYSVRQAAQVDANARAIARFINGPGFSCGDARPF